jgi:hypothetical protein
VIEIRANTDCDAACGAEANVTAERQLNNVSCNTAMARALGTTFLTPTRREESVSLDINSRLARA